jgi:UDP-N-acetyl-alpha-D-quinovosamine dehydrogenase
VTGAAGFIGRALCRALVEHGHRVVAVTRTSAVSIPGVELRAIGDIGLQTDWGTALAGVDIVVHLATSAHRPISPAIALAEAQSAAALVRAARAAGTGRFLLVSSLRAMGEATRHGMRFHADDSPAPRDGYGRAKLEIEDAVTGAAQANELDLVILRPPLVYGPGVKGNFRTLIRLAASGLPLPFAGLQHRRSLIYLDNLIGLLTLACTHPEASGRVLLARDSVDFSIPELLRMLADGLGRPVRLFSLPPALFAGLGLVPYSRHAIRRLTSPLLVDDGETRRVLGWRPAIPPEVGITATARAFALSR